MADPDRETHLNDGTDLEIAHPEDFGISYGPDGEELQPVTQRIPGTDKAIKCKPLVESAVEKFEEVLEEDSADDDQTDAFLQEYVVEGLGQDGLKSCPDYLVPSVIEAVKRSSGYEVFLELQQERQKEQAAAYDQIENMPDEVREILVEQLEDTMANEMGETDDTSDESEGATEAGGENAQLTDTVST